ncbi:MAG TPA: ATPase domain-containing protein [Nevskiaceae bacterium]|nr:ATPase domain-containing protein [Nevskiaceae bacterium]
MSTPESHVRPLLRLPSGIPGLDGILSGGFPKAGITILQGTPGAGKTIFGNQLCHHHVRNGGKAIYVTLLAESHARMLLHMSQLRFFDPSMVPERLYLISAFRVLEENGLKGLQDLLRREVQRFGATVLVLDGLVAAEESAGTAREFKKFIHELQTQASMTDCTMFLLTGVQSRMISPEHTMVDGVIELRCDAVDHEAIRTLTVHKMRGVAMIGGRHALKITSEGLEVFPRLEAVAPDVREQSAEFVPISSGLPPLDAMVGGGLPSASTTLVVGPAGVGKTTLGLHFLSHCTAAEPGVFLGLYETPRSLAMKAETLNLPVGRLMRDGVVEVLWFPTTEGLVDEVCTRLLEASRRRGVRRVFIDGLGGLQSLMHDPRRLSRVLAALSIAFQHLSATTVITAESAAAGGIHDLPLDGLSLHGVSAVAQNIVMMRYVELRNRLHRALSALKVRNGPVDPQMRLFKMTGAGIEIDPDAMAVERVLAQADAARRGFPQG